MYSAFNHWAHWSHMLTVLSMFLPCTQWVFGPLSPVSSPRYAQIWSDLNITNSKDITLAKANSLGARGGVLGQYTVNTLQGYGQSTHYILTWVLEVHS